MVKFTVANFVKAMSGAKVAVIGSTGEKAEVDYKSLLESQTQLGALNVTSAVLDSAVADYQAGLAAANLETDKAEKNRLFDELATTTRRAVKETQGPVKLWKQLGERQRTLITEINQTLGAQLGQIAAIKIGKIRTILKTRLEPLQVQVVFAGDAEALAKHLGKLEGVKATIADTDVGRLLTAAETYQAELAKIAQSLTDFKASVGAVPTSPLRSVMDGVLKTFQDNAKTLSAEPDDLFGLVYKSQGLTDLNDEIKGFDIAAAGVDLKQYQTNEAAIRARHSKITQEATNLPDSPLSTEVNQKLAACIAGLIPASQIANSAQLEKARADLPQLDADLAALELKSGSIAQYARDLAAVFTFYDQKKAQADALQAGALRDALKGSLTALLNTVVPLAEVKDLSVARPALSKVLDSFNAFDIPAYLKIAQTYQQRMGEWLSTFDERSKEVAAVSDAAARAAMQKFLDGFKAETKLLADITTIKELEERTKKFPDIEARLRGLDLNAAAADALEKQKGDDALLQTYQKELAALKSLIDSRVKELAGKLGSGAQNALRKEFETDLHRFGTLAAGENPNQKLTAIRNRAKEVAEHKISTDVESRKRLERADKRAAGAQSQIDGLTDPDLQKKAQAALDNMKAKLDQLKVGLNAGSMGAEMAIGAQGEGTFARTSLNSKEQMRAMDTAIKALTDSLKDATGVKMLEFEGGDAFADGMTKMYGALVAFGASHKGISPAEALSIQRYTGNDYSAMNRNRRGVEDSDRLDFLNKTCDEALAKMPAYPEAAWPSYRFETAWSQDVVDKRYAKGRQFTCGVLWSTGARGSAVIGAASSPSIDHVIYGKKGRDVAALSANTGEGARSGNNDFNPASGRGEVLFPADSAFTVQGRTDTPAANMDKLVYVNEPYQGKMDTNLKEVSNG
tara:strand:+ start:27275 stop:30013 length:2739 start_codon:yes stop_codon:yes gene_type:complete